MCNAIKSLLKCGLQLVITICNFVLLAAGIVLVVAGSIFLYKAKNEDPSGEEGTTVETSVIIALGTITALGALLAIIGFCGCCGTLCRNPCMLKTYAIIQLIIFLGVAAGLIFVLLWNNGLDDEWPRQVKEDYGQIESVTEIWDSRMTRFQCCGDDSYEDWRFSYYARTTNFSVPETCCKVDPETGNYTDLEKCREEGTMFDLEEYEAFHLNVEGCDYLISKSESVIIGISSFLLVFQLLSMILACMLVKEKSKTDQIA